MSGIFHEGCWYENTDMICRRCGRPVYDSDNPEYCYQCFHCDEDFYSFEVEEQDALYLPPVMVARPVDGITLNEALEYLLDDTGKTRIFHVKIKLWCAELRSCMAKRVPPRGIAHLRPEMKLPDIDTGGRASLPPPVSCVSLRNVLF